MVAFGEFNGVCYNRVERIWNMSLELPLNTMSVSEKVQLLEQVWDNLCHQSGDVRSPEWHAAILKERQQQIKDGRMTVSPWSEAKERLQQLGK